MSDKFPFRTTVSSVLQSRYGSDLPQGSSRPSSWDDRKDGVDVVVTDSGETLRLYSDGQQSVPQKGWVILVTSGNNTSGFHWTLFGMPKGCEVQTC